ncbi:MAG TPA: hypothetical protein VK625_13845 [Flavitalea sp.]|nr:hypothetical protein [Flavitalea sp.]
MKSLRLALIINLFMLFGLGYGVMAQDEFDKEGFYNAMTTDQIQQIDLQLKEAEKVKGTDKHALIGTLTMKKAGLISGAGKKLKMFKAGHKELEAAISQDKDNAEYRFMRLMIQEHSPGILGYKEEIQTDSDYIRKSFKNLPGPVQQAIIHYAREKSKVLSEKDFN